MCSHDLLLATLITINRESVEMSGTEMKNVAQTVTVILPDWTAEHVNVPGERSDVVIAYVMRRHS